MILRREEYSAMTARTLLHFCEPLVLRGLLAAAGISVSRPLLSKDSEVVEVALRRWTSSSKDPAWLEEVPRWYSSDNLRRRQNPDGLPLSLTFSPSRLTHSLDPPGNSFFFPPSFPFSISPPCILAPLSQRYIRTHATNLPIVPTEENVPLVIHSGFLNTGLHKCPSPIHFTSHIIFIKKIHILLYFDISRCASSA